MVRSFMSLLALNTAGLALLMIVVVMLVNPAALESLLPNGESSLQTFKTIFISLVLEAIPFILLGVLVSSFMQVFVSDKWIRRFVPSNPVLGIMFACLLGIVFPVCECGMIPVIRRLIAKGLPQYIGIVFILVGPIVNPVVYAATYTAFRAHPQLLYTRMGLALFVGAAIGLIIYRFVKFSALKHSPVTMYAAAAGDEHAGHTQGSGRIVSMFEHAGSEFIDMGKYLIFGCVLTALIQSFVPRDSLMAIGQGPVTSHLFMMGFAYLLSLCSTSDAFVASSFVGTFSAGSLVTFMVFGPMLDFKSTLMLLSAFKTRFVLLLAALLVLFVLVGSIAAEHLLPAS